MGTDGEGSLDYKSYRLTVELQNPVCPEDRIVYGNIEENATFQASETIISNAVITNNSAINYKAGTSIQLNAGFTVNKGSTFLGDIETCNSLSQNDSSLKEGKTFDIFNDNINIHPNPTSGDIHIAYKLEHSATTELSILDAKGMVISQVKNKSLQDKGIFSYPFKTENLNPGLYFVILRIDSKVVTKKLVVLSIY